MWLSPVPLALVGCALELALQPEDIGEEAAGRGLGAFTSLAPQREISLPIQCLADSLVQLPLPNSLGAEEEECRTNEWKKHSGSQQEVLQEKGQEAAGFPSTLCHSAGWAGELWPTYSTNRRSCLGSRTLDAAPMHNTSTSFKPDSHHH